ncbi:MAG: hypothetical protein BZ138_00875 [Methanosphaera sp. rholeuAM270]|nr:MAG: hypothetical protein BZ138_00875 [Methanosphaera sp. rholeuAM270]
MEFFTESGKIFLNPDDLFFFKTDNHDYNGIISLIFYSLVLGLVLGIASGDLAVTGILLVASLIIPIVVMFVHSIFVFIFAKLLGGSGSFMNTFNLLSYSAVLNVILIIAIALMTFNPFIIVPVIILVGLWKMVLEIIAVSEEHSIGYGKAFLSTRGISIILIILALIVMGLI